MFLTSIVTSADYARCSFYFSNLIYASHTSSTKNGNQSTTFVIVIARWEWYLFI